MVYTVDERLTFRFRENYAVNLGSFFLLEPWIYPDMFDKGGANEFDGMTNQVASIGLDAAVQKLRSHYNEYFNAIDWNWLKNSANITALRVPIGYWHVNNGAYLDGLPFAPLKPLYAAATPWIFLRNLIAKAYTYKIGIIVDMHGLPGGANADFHSGYNNATATFFTNESYVNIMCNQILPFIVSDVCTPNVNTVGIQIVNEASYESSGTTQKNYYLKAIQAINKIDSTLPVIISDGWNPQVFAEWVNNYNLGWTTVIDTHIYRCYSDSDKSKSAGTIINELPSTANLPKTLADFVIGEFSCVLDEATWQKTSGDRTTWIKNFGQTQVSVFNSNAGAGWFFWTLKFKYGDGGEWGFVPCVNKGFIPERSKTTVNIDSNAVNNLIKQHQDYWNKIGGSYEFWRYSDALNGVVDDIKKFSSYNNSRIGRWAAWKKIRRSEYIASKGDSQYMWEWDQGFQAGLDNFNKY
ncbi:hypothetical protein KAFR_0A01010 [Kazachstania africana CBS 2517]|uniref:Glycoside hydrolase family 5 domain-containing protein n=1 Tax=Kazachstania africana (strain ATCC 22294 / BCRC 22015 / CBS 2517 / CECT 1963 / NBRC 1671 / NRRL Y-8276) TaxID=1071382 RepID=H2AMD9_KAZAF|nr:hypothetical protein KAFR_0A01010 [Kazachstania africana CBS 2517]CCF55539.1 hypothetical protein KAFR_0A01010 [Kazachstania africana CBS 2517]